MAMSTKLINNHLDTRRALRSGSKHPHQNNNPIFTKQSDKVTNEIKMQFEFQEANNFTTNNPPLHDDIQSLHQPTLQFQQPSKASEIVRQLNYQCQSCDKNISVPKPVESNQQAEQNSSEEKNKPVQYFQKKQTCFSTPPVKSYFKVLKKTQSSLYHEKRKSYRKTNKNRIRSVPFRKCQDQLQNKIIVLINKICQQKHNEKEIESFCEKIYKISFKDIYNPYVISGIQTIINLLVQKQQQINVTSASKLKNEVRNLSQRIWMQLGKVDDYEKAFYERKQIDFDVTKPKLVRKVYRMLVQQQKYEPNTARQKSFQAIQSLFTKCNNQTTQQEMMDLLKENKILQI